MLEFDRAARAADDRLQEATLAELEIGKRRLTFAATDYATTRERYASLVGQKVDVAVYGLATLAPGGAEAMREQIKDCDRVEVTPHLVRLIQAGRLSLDGLITHEFPLAEINAALDVVRSGNAGRVLLHVS